ncbi:MAG: hypothetical protein JOY80_05645 [Candidatus Dormibacteraeota bacterium]|nr:hypothetical protein [Candidatus Dormibacteraeota bacterium]
MSADAFFDGEDSREIGRALDRDTRVGAVALLCALVLAAAASGSGHAGGQPARPAVTPAQSQAQAVLGQVPVASRATGPAHVTSGGS